MEIKRLMDRPSVARIRLMATTDLHMHLTGFDYSAGRSEPSIGLTRVATLIQAAREEYEAVGDLCLLLDNGDALQGGPMGEVACTDGGDKHPLVRAFAFLGYDAIGLGNHDFDYGLEALARVVADAPFPVVCSNMTSFTGGPAVPGLLHETILKRDIQTHSGEGPKRIRIGIVSLIPPQTINWNAHFLKNRVSITDQIETAEMRIASLRKRDCDLVLLLAHCGIGSPERKRGIENAIIPLCELPGVDAVVGGHTHVCFPGHCHHSTKHVDSENGYVHNTPTVLPGSAGSHLGVIDLDLDLDQDGRWRVIGSTSRLRAVVERDRKGRIVSSAAESAPLKAELAKDHIATLSSLERPAGKSDQPLHSYFTFIARDRSLAVVAAAQAAAVRPHLERSWAKSMPLLSAVAPGKFGARAGPSSFTDVPAGPLLHRHLVDLQIFPNKLQLVLLTGAQVKDWLEMSASLFRQIEPGTSGAPLLNPDIPGHDFDVLHGLSYEFDLSQPARFHADGRVSNRNAHRALNVTHNGHPVWRDQLFVVAVNHFRANGGGHFAALRNAQPVIIPTIFVRDALEDYLSGIYPQDAIEIMPQPWRFRAMPGTSVHFKTGPGATHHLDEIADCDYDVLGIDEEGFLRLSVQL